MCKKGALILEGLSGKCVVERLVNYALIRTIKDDTWTTSEQLKALTIIRATRLMCEHGLNIADDILEEIDNEFIHGHYC